MKNARNILIIFGLILVLAVVFLVLGNKGKKAEPVVTNEPPVESTTKETYNKVIQIFGEDVLTGYQLEIYSKCDDKSCEKESFEIKSATGFELAEIKDKFIEGNIVKSKTKKMVQVQCIKAPCDPIETEVEVVDITEMKEVKIPEDKKNIIEGQTLN